MTICRNETNKDDAWNVEALYSSLQAWETDFSEVCGDETAVQRGENRWPQVAEYCGRLTESPTVVKEALELILSISRNLEKLYTYAHLRNDEDVTHDTHKSIYQRAVSACMVFGQETAWFNPELLALPSDTLDTLLSLPELTKYAFHLEKIIRARKHTLSSEKEQLIALAAPALQAASKAFSAINDADFDFGTVLDGAGKERELTHASYGLYLRERDRTLRKNTFNALCEHYRGYENTLTELLSGQVQKQVFNTRARNYGSCLDAALFPNNIDTAVYRSLIKAVRNKLPLLHQYTSLRKQLLNVEELHMYDLYVPLVDEVDIKMDYRAAEEAVIASVAPLGGAYQEILARGLRDDRWVDRYENLNKRSGAYSSGCFDSMPYILMNYKGVLRDVFTLAHEAGHSMHSYLSRESQPYHYADYPIFLAEVASTFNEELLMQHLLTKFDNPTERAYLINEKIEDIRATLIRQTMFAEFELWINESIERGKPLTPSRIKDEYARLNIDYFGPDVVIDDAVHIEWARIPHFYYNFYVYQYATGISAALALAKRVIQGNDGDREAYLTFLKSGCSRYPLDLLKEAGVDLTTPQPVETALDRFGELITDLEGMLVSPSA
ncbi:Oligoendopeptidase F homolog [Chlamydiales bacterium SCGC AG-110-P3]|nr:Oligoendopeptidase F homolog [Chlamydiales bacterium SCGC AG-110-P3]